jgi:hypothetical protein
VRAIQKAVSDKTGRSELYVCDDNNGMHSIQERTGTRTLAIETVTLDEYLADFTGEIDFIKMDIEGAEIHALRGMQKTLRRYPHVKVFVEFAPMNMRAPESEAPELLRLIADAGLTIYDIEGKSGARVTPAQLLSKYTAARKNHTNILCVKE